jgi:hypothetical protein
VYRHGAPLFMVLTKQLDVGIPNFRILPTETRIRAPIFINWSRMLEHRALANFVPARNCNT